MANKIGNAIKKARTDAGLTQEQLARKVKNVSTAEIGKAERGELKLTQDALKQIAKATGVTQKSLLDAAASSIYKSSGTSSSSSSSKKTTASKTSSSGTSMKVSSTEKKLVELYREANSDTKKKAMELLKTGQISMGSIVEDAIQGLLGDTFSKLK